METVKKNPSREQIRGAEGSLKDLLHIKATNSFNEYVTAENIDEWISGQKRELKRFRKEYRNFYWELMQVSYRFPYEERERIKEEYEWALNQLT